MLQNPFSYSVLIVDDEPEIRKTIIDAFENDSINWHIFQAASLCAEIKQLSENFIDLIVQDVSLTDGCGFSAITEIKKSWKNRDPKFLVLSSNTDEKTRQTSFFVGAQEYMAKPFYASELILRAKRLLNIEVGAFLSEKVYREGYIRVNFEKCFTIINGAKIVLTENEKLIFNELLESHGVNLIELSEKIGLRSSNLKEFSEKYLQVSISRLRVKFLQATGRKVIQRERGRGYFI